MVMVGVFTTVLGSLPPRGAWIEICLFILFMRMPTGSLPPRGAWIEITPPCLRKVVTHRSLPPRGAWIEMPTLKLVLWLWDVAPPTGSVD